MLPDPPPTVASRILFSEQGRAAASKHKLVKFREELRTEWDQGL